MRQVRIALAEPEWRQVRAAAIAAGVPLHAWIAAAALHYMHKQQGTVAK